MTIAVDTVCTETALRDEIGGQELMDSLLAQSKASSSVNERTLALRDVLKALSRRTPPILDTDLSDVTELTDAVAYGAAARLYQQAASTPDSIYETRRKMYQERFESECEGLMPTLTDELRGAASSWSTERR